MHIKLEQLSESDFNTILDMMARFNAIDDYPFNRTTRKTLLQEFYSNNTLGNIWKIMLSEQTIGYIVLTFGFSFEYNGRDAFIDELYIEEPFRNKGYGNQTMKLLEAEAKLLGVNAIHLEVENTNNNAHHLYIKSGYKGNSRQLLTKTL